MSHRHDGYRRILYVLQDCPHSKKARQDLEGRRGLHVRILEVGANREALKQMYALAKKHGVPARVPLFSSARKIVVGYDSTETTGHKHDDLLTVSVYLLLYNLAYMLDDGLMVAMVVMTLRKNKMHERAGRWLKLIREIAILSLGVLLLFVPEWLL